jgi:hypothetical protein
MGANQFSRGKQRLGKGIFTIVAQATAVVNPASLIDAAGEIITPTAVLGSFVGVALGDIVLVGAGVDLQGITVTAYVSAADTVKVRLQNESGGTLDLASSTWKFMVVRPFFS